MTGLSIILPTYNEAGNIKELILDCVQYAKSGGITAVEVLVVDDNSPDGTAAAAESVPANDFHLRVMRRLQDRGFTKSLREGIAVATYDTVFWCDCDFSHPPETIPQMIYMMNEGYDAVVNSRYVAGGGEERVGKGGQLQQFLSRSFNWSVRFLLDPNFSDYTSGFILVRKEVLDAFPLRGDYGEYFIDLVYRILKSKYRICELPYYSKPRRSGESKTGAGFNDFARKGLKYFQTALSLRFQRLRGRL